MSLRLEKFDGTKTYMYPNGLIADPDKFRADFPAIEIFTHVLEVNGNVCQAVMELSALRAINNIDEELTEDEAIAAIEVIINTPPAEAAPSPEERIAAALEFQNLMSL